MRLHDDITINGKLYPAGTEISAWKIYPFFLLRQAAIDATGSRDNPARRRMVERAYIVISVLVYLGIYLLGS